MHRPSRPSPAGRCARREQFAYHPIGLAALLALAGPAFALPQGATVVSGEVTVQQPSATLQVVTQGSASAIVDWRSFSIAAGETVRFNQPNASSVVLNRVVGYDPSSILGRLQANGQVFLLNPQGVVFGAGARVDVGGLVASTLSMSNADFAAGRYQLTAQPGARLGEVRNDGSLHAPGGSVVLAGPNVTNSGVIQADGGRVALAAANSVLVDVEGDGLVLFEAPGDEAGNRLAQLGRIQADGGRVELRALARGSFADTVLNMNGVVQARGLGVRDGKVVIDGGAVGTTVLAGTVDASGAAAGQHGGDVSVTGQRVLVGSTAAVDATGADGGGRIRIGGGWHGEDATLRSAERTTVAAGAVLDASARNSGAGGEAVVWSDHGTRFDGSVRAAGGAAGGDGGRVEISGRDGLAFAGRADVSAAAGRAGSVLFDPTNITVATAGTAAPGDVDQFADPGAALVIAPSALENVQGNVTLQATRDITVTDAVALSTAGASFTARAGNNIAVNNAITTTGGAITLTANDAGGPASGTGQVTIAGNLSGSSVTVNGPALVTGSRTITGTGAVRFGNDIVGGGGDLTLNGTGTKSLNTVGGLATITTAGGTTTLNGDVTTTTAQDWGDVVTSGPVTLTTPQLTTNGVLNAGANDLALQVDGVSIGNGAPTGTGGFRLAPYSAASSISVASSVVADANYGSGVLNFFLSRGFTSLTVGRRDSTGTVDVGTGNTLNLRGLTAFLSGSGSINLGGTIVGNGNLIAVTTGGATTLGATLVNVGSFSNGGRTLITTDVTTTGAQQYAAAELGANVTLTGRSIAFGSLNAANRNLALQTDNFTFITTPTNLAAVTLSGTTAATSIGVDAGAGTLSLTNARLGLFNGATSLTIGRATGTGAITVASAGPTYTLTRDLAFQSANAAIRFDDAVQGARALTVTNGGTTTTTAALTGLTRVTVNGTGTTVLGGDVTTTIAQSYGAVSLAAGATLSGRQLTLGPVTGNANALTLTASVGTSIASATGLASLTANGAGPTTLGGNVSTSGAQGYGAVTLGADAVLAGSTLALGAVTGGGNDLTLTAAGGASVGSASGLTTLTANGAGATTLNGNVTTSGAQSFGAVALGADAVLTGSTLALGSIAGNGSDLTLTAATGASLGSASGLTTLTASGAGPTTLNGDVTTGGAQRYGNVNLGADAALAGSTLTLGAVSGGGNDLTLTAVNGASVGSAGGLATLTANGAGATTLNGNVTTTGAQRYGALALGADTTLTGSDIAVGGAVSGGANSLTVAPSATATLARIDARAFTTAGAGTTTLGGDVTTTVDQTYNGNVRLGAPAVLTAPQLNFLGNLDAGANDLALQFAGGGFGGTLTGSGQLRLAGQSAAQSIGIASAVPADLNLGQGVVNQLFGGGFGSLAFGRPDGTGAITIGSLALPADTTLVGASAPVSFGGGLAGNGHALNITTGGTTTIGGTVGGLTSLAVAGPASLNGSITSTGAQRFDGGLALSGPATLTGTQLAFGGAVPLARGANALVMNTRDLVLASASTGTGPVTLGAFTAGESVSVAAALPATSAYSADEIGRFAGTSALTLGRADGSGAVTVGAFTLPADTTVAGSTATVDLQGAISGAGRALTITPGGATTLAAAPTGLSSLSIAGPATLPGGTLSTSGNQRYARDVALSADLTLDAANLDFGGALALGNHALTLQFDGTLGGPLSASGSGVFSLAPRNAASTIGVAGGPGTFQVSQATLDGLAGLPNLGVGRADGTGTVTVGAVTLPANLQLRSGSGNVALTDGASGQTHDLGITTSGTTSLAGAFTGLGAFDIAGPTTLAGATTVTADTVRFGATLDGAQTLTVDAGQASLAGAVGGATPLAGLTVNAPLALDGGRVATTGVQVYRDAVTLGAATTLNAGSVDFTSTVDGAQALTIDSAGITRFGGVVGGTSALTRIATDGPGTTLLAADVTTTGAQSYGDATQLAGPVTLGGDTVAFGGTVDGAQALTVDAADTTLAAAVGATTPLASLSVTGGTVALPASVTTTGAQSYAAVARLPGATTLQASAIDFARGVQAGASDVLTRSDTLTLGGAATGSGQWFAEPLAAGTSIGLGSGAGTLQLDNAFLGALSGFSRLTIGRADGSAAIRSDSLLLSVPTTVQGAGASLELAGTTDGRGHSLDVQVGGLTTVSGTASGLSGVDIAGPARLDGGRVASTGAQTWHGPLEVLGTSSLDAGTLALQGAVDGTGALAITSTGGSSVASTVGAATPLASLSVDGPVQLAGGSVRTTGAQRYGGAVTLAADTTLTGNDIALLAGADGSHALALQSSGTATLVGAFGAAAPLASLDIAGAARLAAELTTIGTQRYAGAVALDGATRLTGGAIDLAGTVDGAQALVLASAGPLHVGGSIGGSTPLASLDVQGGAPVRLDGTLVATTAAQRYGTAVQLAPGARVSAGTLEFGATVQAGRDLLLEADALQAAAAITGSGTLAIAPRNAGVSVGVAGGAGALQVTQALLDAASGFTQHVIGRADATAPLDVGALTLKADTTLRAGQADLAVRGGIDGPFDLQLQSGGTTLITASLGTTQALRSLSTDNQPAASDWNGNSGEHVRFDGGAVAVVTTGAQTYLDPVVGRVALTLVADTLNAVQAGNRFEGPLSGQLGEVQLSTGGALDLGDLRIARGGTIDAGGVLGLRGALQLGGGTLTLQSAAQPGGGALQDAALAGRTLQIGGARLQETGAAIGQSVGSTIDTDAGSRLVALAPGGGSVLLDQDGNTLRGTVSAVSGTPGDSGAGRLGSGATNSVGFVRLRSSELHLDAVEADAVLLSADRIDQSAGSVVRARVPLLAGQGIATSLPGLTVVPSTVALATEGSFGSAGSGLRVQVGDASGGLVTTRPLPAPVPSSTVFLRAGGAPLTYALAGQADAVRVVIDGSFVLTPRELAARRLSTASTSALPTLPGFATAAGAAPGDEAGVAEAGTTRPPEACRPLPGTLKCE